MTNFIGLILISYFALSNLISLFLLAASFFSVRHFARLQPLIRSLKDRSGKFAPTISVVAPAYNEEKTIVESVRSFLLLRYPRFEIIIVNDGSLDQTMEVLTKNFELEERRLFYDSRLSKARIRAAYVSRLHPNLMVIDKENSGKADSTNVGVGFSRCELFCSVDSDSMLDDDSLLRVAIPFVTDPEKTVAAGGTIRPVNGSLIEHGRVTKLLLPRNPLVLIQIVEYMRAFMFGRIGWNVINSTMIISGAFGVFRKKSVFEVGGYQEGSLGEDMELILRLRKHYAELGKPIHIAFIPDPICWTEVPSTLAVLGHQRNRWQRGLAETLLTHKGMFLNPRYGMSGVVAYPYFLLFELFGPVIEISAILFVTAGLYFGYLGSELLILFILADPILSFFMSLGALFIEETAFHKYPKLRHIFVLMIAALAENLGYRQFVLFHRLAGLVSYMRKDRSWGQMSRVGFQPSK